MAEPSTPPPAAGLSSQALSALEPFGVATVVDLVAVDPADSIGRVMTIAPHNKGTGIA